MGLEVVQYISDLNVNWPVGTDKVRQGAGHLRNIKTALANTFPLLAGPVELSDTQLNLIPAYLDAFISHLFPTGGIVAWSGAADAIPAGWALCDGGGSTPDLRGKFILGAGDVYGVGDTGGAESTTSEVTVTGLTVDTHALDATEIPAHKHYMFVDNNGDGALTGATYVLKQRTSAGDSNYSMQGSATVASVGLTSGTGGGVAHGHGVTDVGHTHDVATLPPYFALCYIMKTLTWDL